MRKLALITLFLPSLLLGDVTIDDVKPSTRASPAGTMEDVGENFDRLKTFTEGLEDDLADDTGTGSIVREDSPTLVTPALGTPSAIVLTNGTGLPVATGISGLGSGVATALATPSSANLRSAVSDESGTGNLLFQGGILNDSITDLSSGTALSINTLYYDTFSADRTFTISGSPTEGSFIEVFATMSADVTLTFPTVNRLLNESAAAAAVLYPVGFHKISLEYRNSAWWLIDSGGPLNNFSATGAPAVTNDIDEGYGVGSLWIDVSNDNSYICSDNTDGAAVWTQIDAAGGASVEDAAYGAGWNGDTTNAPSQNAVYDKIESLAYSDLSNDQVYTETFTILEPDAVQGVSDDIVLKKFNAESYPSGVTITAIHIDASAAYTSETFLFEHWDDASGSTQATVESIAASSISTEDDGTLSDATIPADYFLVLNFDDTPEDKAYVAISISYTID